MDPMYRTQMKVIKDLFMYSFWLLTVFACCQMREAYMKSHLTLFHVSPWLKQAICGSLMAFHISQWNNFSNYNLLFISNFPLMWQTAERKRKFHLFSSEEWKEHNFLRGFFFGVVNESFRNVFHWIIFYTIHLLLIKLCACFSTQKLYTISLPFFCKSISFHSFKVVSWCNCVAKKPFILVMLLSFCLLG